MLNRPSIRRVLEDKLRAEIVLARAGAAESLPPSPWPDDLPIGPAGLGADSLDLLNLAAAVNEMFHIHDTGTEDTLLVRRRFGDWVDLIEQSWRQNPARISFRSSGSTGRPKRCTHAMSALLAETLWHAERLRPRRILTAVPSHHIYGFIFTVLLPLVAGCEVTGLGLAEPFREGDVIVSFPDHWRFMARSFNDLSPAAGVTSAASMPPDLARDLTALGLVRLLEIYGSSETAGIGWREKPGAPFALLPDWSVAEAPHADGVLRLSGLDGRRAETPDVVTMTGARAFRVLRRLDGAVQVGGVNVFPDRIAEMLEQHPLVARAAVRLAPDGGRLKALIVPAGEVAEAVVQTALTAWIAANLSAAEQPRSLTFAAALPAGGYGKPADWQEAAPALSPEPEPALA